MLLQVGDLLLEDLDLLLVATSEEAIVAVLVLEGVLVLLFESVEVVP